MIYYINGVLLTFAFGCYVYTRKDIKLKKEMKFPMFLFCNALASIIFFITVPIVFYLSFFTKSKSNV